MMDMFKDPPNMLSTKDVAMLHELLASLLTNCKKIKYYEDQVEDEKISKRLKEVNKLLSRQYKQLLEVLS